MANKDLGELDISDLLDVVKTAAFLKKIAEAATQNLKTRVRLGYAVAQDSGPQGKFKPLADSTVSKRRKLKSPPLSENTTPKRSNLTQTGELIDSITYRISGNKIEIYLEGARNQKVAEYVTPARPFFHLSAIEVSRLVDIVDSALNTYLKQRN